MIISTLKTVPETKNICHKNYGYISINSITYAKYSNKNTSQKQLNRLISKASKTSILINPIDCITKFVRIMTICDNLLTIHD